MDLHLGARKISRQDTPGEHHSARGPVTAALLPRKREVDLHMHMHEDTLTGNTSLAGDASHDTIAASRLSFLPYLILAPGNSLAPADLYLLSSNGL